LIQTFTRLGIPCVSQHQRRLVLLAKAQGLPASDHSSADIVLSAPVRFSQSGRATRFIQPDDRAANSKVDSLLIDLLVKARCQRSKLSGGTMDITALARAESVNDSWITRVVRLNFLAPELITAILDGSQPPGSTLQHSPHLVRCRCDG